MVKHSIWDPLGSHLNCKTWSTKMSIFLKETGKSVNTKNRAIRKNLKCFLTTNLHSDKLLPGVNAMLCAILYNLHNLKNGKTPTELKVSLLHGDFHASSVVEMIPNHTKHHKWKIRECSPYLNIRTVIGTFDVVSWTTRTSVTIYGSIKVKGDFGSTA